MAKKQGENGNGELRVIIPDFTGSRGGNAGLGLQLWKVGRSKDELWMDLTVELQTDHCPENWPPLLQSVRSWCVESMAEGGKPARPQRDVGMMGAFTLASVTGGVTDDPIFNATPATLRHVKLVAKEGQLRIRWTFRVRPEVRYMGPLLVISREQADCEVAFVPAQQALVAPKTKPKPGVTTDLADA